MFIFKVAKLIVKTFLGIALGIAIIAVIISVICDIHEASKPVNDWASHIVWMHQVCEKAPVGTVLACPICEKNGNPHKNFTKTDPNINCCNAAEEAEYQAIYQAWMATQGGEETAKKYGVQLR